MAEKAAVELILRLRVPVRLMLAAVVALGRMALLLPVALVVAVVVRRMEIHLETEELIRAAVVVERSTLPAVLAVLV